MKQRTPIILLREFLDRHLGGSWGYELSTENERLLRAAIAALKDYSKVKAECLSHFRGKDGMGTCDPGCQWYPGDGNVCPMSRAGLMADLEKAEAKLEKVKDNLDMMTKNRDHWLEKTQGAKAKLARFAPLIEAAEKVSERDLGRVFMGFISTEMRELLEAIKSSKSGTVSRGKDDIPGENPGEPKGDGDPVDDGMSPEDMKKREEQFKYDEMERRHEQSVEDAHDKESEPKGGRE